MNVSISVWDDSSFDKDVEESVENDISDLSDDYDRMVFRSLDDRMDALEERLNRIDIPSRLGRRPFSSYGYGSMDADDIGHKLVLIESRCNYLKDIVETIDKDREEDYEDMKSELKKELIDILDAGLYNKITGIITDLIGDSNHLYSKIDDIFRRLDALENANKTFGVRNVTKAKVEDLNDIPNKSNESNSDPVNHPSHYTDGKYEVIDFIEWYSLPYHLGNAVKYICRAGKKDPDKRIEDLRKAEWYLRRWAEYCKRSGKGYVIDISILNDPNVPSIKEFCEDKGLCNTLSEVIHKALAFSDSAYSLFPETITAAELLTSYIDILERKKK